MTTTTLLSLLAAAEMTGIERETMRNGDVLEFPKQIAGHVLRFEPETQTFNLMTKAHTIAKSVTLLALVGPEARLIAPVGPATKISWRGDAFARLIDGQTEWLAWNNTNLTDSWQHLTVETE